MLRAAKSEREWDSNLKFPGQHLQRRAMLCGVWTYNMILTNILGSTTRGSLKSLLLEGAGKSNGVCSPSNKLMIPKRLWRTFFAN
jgi:hypothetical protein